MNKFLVLEAGNLTVAAFFLAIAIVVATRPFVRKEVKRFILIATISIFTILIAGHYYITSKRISEVKSAFASGEKVECESRLNRKAAQSIVISKDLGWKLDGDLFINPNYSRPFHSARCIVKVKPKIDLPSH